MRLRVGFEIQDSYIGQLRTNFMFVWLSLILLISSSAKAENICHKKPPGECEKCCSYANQKNFHRAIELACGRVASSQVSHEVAFKAELDTYVARSQSESGNDVELFEAFLREHCVLKSGHLNNNPLSVTYSECSKGCPKGKSSRKIKK